MTGRGVLEGAHETTRLGRGTNVRFRIIGGTFRVVVKGRGINLSLVGKGNVTLKGAGTVDDGSYSVNGGGYGFDPRRSVPVRPVADQSLTGAMSSSTQSVLVVEDEASIASFVSLYLKNAGYEVRTRADGAEALASVQQRAALADRARPDAPGHRRDRGLPAHPAERPTCRS